MLLSTSNQPDRRLGQTELIRAFIHMCSVIFVDLHLIDHSSNDTSSTIMAYQHPSHHTV